MAELQRLIESGNIVLIMLAVVALEALVLLVLWHSHRQGVAPLDLLANLGAGGSLMLALYLALTGADWRWLTAALLLSLACHSIDMLRRWTPAGRSQVAGRRKAGG